MGENETEIDFVLSKKEHRQFVQNVKAIAGELQIASLRADIDKKKLRKAVRKACAERRKITLLKDVTIRKRFKKRVTESVDGEAPNLWGHLKDVVLKACDEVCGKKGRSKGDTWWRNEEVKEEVSRKIDAHKAMHQDNTEENNLHKSMKNKANKAISKTMREKAVDALTELKTDSKEVEGERCMRGSDEKLCFSEKERSKVRKDYVECIMNEENYCDHNVEGDTVEGSVVCVSREEVLQALNEIKRGKAHRRSEVLLKPIAASGGVGI